MARPGRPAKPKMPMPKWVGGFLNMLVAEKGAARNTQQAYERDLADACAYFDKVGVDLIAAKTKDIEGYLNQLADKQHTKGTRTKQISARTVARRLSALRQFYRYLISEKVRNEDPTGTIDSPKQERTLPKILTEGEVQSLIQTAAENGGPQGTRLVCLLEMLYATGLRVSEMVGLPLTAVGEGEEFLIVAGKGGRERMAPLTDSAVKALKSYLSVRKHFINPESVAIQGQWLFPSKTSIAGHLTRQRFAQILKDLAHDAGVPEERVSPHVLRHAFASHLLRNGADMRSLQKMLGHADITTTQIYTHMINDALKKTVEEKHPLAKKSGTK